MRIFTMMLSLLFLALFSCGECFLQVVRNLYRYSAKTKTKTKKKTRKEEKKFSASGRTAEIGFQLNTIATSFM